MTMLLLSECEPYQSLLLLIYMKPNIEFVLDLTFKCQYIIICTLFWITPIFMFTLAILPAANILCLVVFQTMCCSFVKTTPSWLSILLILLSHDIHMHPGPEYQNTFLNFMTWNLNSITTNEFARVRLIEAHNSMFNYDLISICETNLTDSLV